MTSAYAPADPDFAGRVRASFARQGIMALIGAQMTRVEAGLVETILDDVADRPGTLPLLEHALLELWERRRGHLLTLEAYRESGGVQGAIAARAESVFAALEPDQQALIQRVLLRLIQPGIAGAVTGLVLLDQDCVEHAHTSN